MMEALWLHQYHNVVDVDLLKRMLGSPDFHARAAATRVLCYWRDRVPDALELLKKQAADEHPRVRLEAVRAASFFTVPEAIEVLLDRPTNSRPTSISTSSAPRRMKAARSARQEGDPRQARRSTSPRRRGALLPARTSAPTTC